MRDNNYLMGSGAITKTKLTPKFGILSLRIMHDQSVKSSVSQENICPALKLVEVLD